MAVGIAQTGGRKTPIQPAKIFLLGLLALIAVGTTLLSLPIAREDGGIHVLDGFFTATSAVCVTGLVVVDTATAYTTFGEIVILLLLQIGGLGYMTAATAIALMIGRRIGIRERVLLKEAHGQLSLRGMVWLTRRTFIFTLLAEAAGAVILAARFSARPDYTLGQGIYHGVFHSVSAFCNAGFDLMGDRFGEFASLQAFSSDAVVTLTIAGLFMAAGLGFIVVSEIAGIRLRPRYSLHTKLVLGTTLVLLVFGTLIILLLEWGNPLTLANMDFGEKALVSVFQSATPRTAGFSTIDVAGMRSVTLAAMMPLMFIGASPGGTGGGIKTTTFVLIILAIWGILKGRRDSEIAGRRLSDIDVHRALAITVLAIILVTIAILVLTLTDLSAIEALDLPEDPFIALVFEVFSAFGTVGLSTGITPFLSPAGKLIVIAVMIIGRLGPLTAIAAFISAERPLKGRLPEEHVAIGS